jgi:4-hydroxythreonine-4-phosphate dehydrogenase
MMEKPVIGITTGDLNGVGLELIIKIFSDNRMLDLCTPVIFASNKAINYYRRIVTEHPFNFTSTKSLENLNPKQVNVFNCWEEEVTITPGELTDEGGKYAVRSLLVATQCLKDGEIDAIVTAPIHKKNTQTPDFNYTGHTPFFRDQFDAKNVVMLLYNGGFRVGLVTEHIPVSEVAQRITTEGIIQKAQILKDALVTDFGISKPKIAVLGLNPHAGDDGLIGQEEITVIKPAIDQLQQAGILAFGPFSADGFFAHHHYRQFDAVLAMYHDQGLIPFKSLNGGEGVNYTCGLPIVRTSPDHGVAFDIAGKNIASPDSMREAVYQAIDILKQREEHSIYTANPLKRQRLAKER